jgi:hypothetical protein
MLRAMPALRRPEALRPTAPSPTAPSPTAPTVAPDCECIHNVVRPLNAVRPR